MANEPPTSWRELKRPHQAKCPKLFYNYAAQDNYIELELTDLVIIWHCRLIKSDIIEAAKSQDVSIDPSGSDTQFKVLLQKLGQALRSDNNTLYHAKDIGSQIVYVKTRLRLPKPLKPLIWTFELVPQSASDLAEHLLRPCLFEASISKQKISSLYGVIKKKDHLLSRLLEKIESTATDLSLIFPGIAGLKSRRGRVSVAEAKAHVPGMKEFDSIEWLKHFHADGPYAGYDQKGIKNLVAGCQVCPDHSAQEHLDWLGKLPRKRRSKNSFYKFSSDVETRDDESLITSEDHSASSEDDFERQATPGKNKRRRKLPGAGDSDEEESRPAIKNKLGRIGNPASRRTPQGKESTKTMQSQRNSSSPVKDQHELDVSTASESDTITKLHQNDEHSVAVTKRSGSSSKSPDESAMAAKTGKASISSTSSSENEDDLDSQPKRGSQRPNKSTQQAITERSSSKSPPPPANDIPQPPRPTLRRLGTIGSRPSQSQVSRTNSIDDPKRPRKQADTARPTKSPSVPLTPRRLGRIGMSQSVTPSPLRFKATPTGKDKDGSKVHDSDSTASASSPNSPTAARRHPGSPAHTQCYETSSAQEQAGQPSHATGPGAKLSAKNDPPKVTKPETAEERANRRRGELKRKIDPGVDGRTTAKRKKRKF